MQRKGLLDNRKRIPDFICKPKRLYSPKEISAIIIIQRHTRGLIARRKYESMLSWIVEEEEEKERKKITERMEIWDMDQEISINYYSSPRKERKRVEGHKRVFERRSTQITSATKIQKIWRGHCVRNKLGDWREKLRIEEYRSLPISAYKHMEGCRMHTRDHSPKYYSPMSHNNNSVRQGAEPSFDITSISFAGGREEDNSRFWSPPSSSHIHTHITTPTATDPYQGENRCRSIPLGMNNNLCPFERNHTNISYLRGVEGRKSCGGCGGNGGNGVNCNGNGRYSHSRKENMNMKPTDYSLYYTPTPLSLNLQEESAQKFLVSKSFFTEISENVRKLRTPLIHKHTLKELKQRASVPKLLQNKNLRLRVQDIPNKTEPTSPSSNLYLPFNLKSERLTKPVIYAFDIYIRAAEEIQRHWIGYIYRKREGTFAQNRDKIIKIQKIFREYQKSKEKRIIRNCKQLTVLHKSLMNTITQFKEISRRTSKLINRGEANKYIERINIEFEKSLIKGIRASTQKQISNPNSHQGQYIPTQNKTDLSLNISSIYDESNRSSNILSNPNIQGEGKIMREDYEKLQNEKNFEVKLLKDKIIELKGMHRHSMNEYINGIRMLKAHTLLERTKLKNIDTEDSSLDINQSTITNHI